MFLGRPLLNPLHKFLRSEHGDLSMGTLPYNGPPIHRPILLVPASKYTPNISFTPCSLPTPTWALTAASTGHLGPSVCTQCDSRRALSNPRQSRPLLAQNFAVASRLSRSRGKGPDDIPGGPGLPHHSAPSAPSSSPHRCSAAQASFPLRAFPSAVPSAWIALSGNISQTFLSLPQVFVLLLWFSH